MSLKCSDHWFVTENVSLEAIFEIKVNLIVGALPMQYVSYNCLYVTIGKNGIPFPIPSFVPFEWAEGCASS